MWCSHLHFQAESKWHFKYSRSGSPVIMQVSGDEIIPSRYSPSETAGLEQGGAGAGSEPRSGERVQLTGLLISQSKDFWALKMVTFFATKSTTDDFSEPPRRADSKSPIFIFCRILGLGHLRAPRVGLCWILGPPSIEPFWGGGFGQGALSTPPSPPPPQLKARPPLGANTTAYRYSTRAQVAAAITTLIACCSPQRDERPLGG